MTSEQPSPNEQPAPDAPGRPDGTEPGGAEVGSTEPGGTEVGSTGTGEPAYREVTVRRAPKFVPFMAIGAILGFVAAFVVAYTGPEDPTLTRESVLGFFTISFAIPGLLLGALVVLIIDRRSLRRAERARAERTYDDERQGDGAD